MTGGVTGFGGTAGRASPVYYSAGGLHRYASAGAVRTNAFAAWLVLIGLILPAWEMQISIADAKFTFGRTSVILLLFPALFALCGRGRRMVISDLFAVAAAIWMIAAPIYVEGLGSLKSAGAVSVEFIGGYMAGRAFFGEAATLDTFIRVLKVLAVTAILVAVADSVTGRWIAHEVSAALFGTTALGPVFRSGTVRAASTFDHPILFGTFCSFVATILLFRETGTQKRVFYVGLCFLGAMLSQSSAALMCFAFLLMAYTYDRAMRSVPIRWIMFWIVVGFFLLIVFFAANRPLGWMVSHLTLEPASGYYRMLIWDAALDRISQNPMAGYGFALFDNYTLDATIDSVWLVLALRFGVPIIVLLILANVTAMLAAKRRRGDRDGGAYVERMRLAFSIVLVMFMFTGLIVHFWNYMWIFWGLCIGIRASLRE